MGKEVPPGMLGTVRSPENQERPPWSPSRSGWSCPPCIDGAGASAPSPASSTSTAGGDPAEPRRYPRRAFQHP
jgi:hypothetical protein